MTTTNATAAYNAAVRAELAVQDKLSQVERRLDRTRAWKPSETVAIARLEAAVARLTHDAAEAAKVTDAARKALG